MLGNLTTITWYHPRKYLQVHLHTNCLWETFLINDGRRTDQKKEKKHILHNNYSHQYTTQLGKGSSTIYAD